MSDSPYVFIVNQDNFSEVVLEGSHHAPVLVDFWADWCAPCRMLMPVLTQLAEGYAGKFLLAKINSDEQQELAARYGVRSLPTVKLFKNGEPVDEFMGALPESAIREFLDVHIPRESDAILNNAIQVEETGDTDQAIAILQTALGEDPENLRIHTQLARLLMSAGRIAEATKVLDSVPGKHSIDDEVVALRQQLGFAEIAASAPSTETLASAIDADPSNSEARYQLSARCIMEGDFESALQQLLEIMRRERSFRDDAGRKGMLAVFQLLGGSGELVSRYRGLMSSALY